MSPREFAAKDECDGTEMSELQQASIPRLLTAEEVAEMLRIPTAHVYELARQAKIPCVHVGRLVRFPQARVLEWIEGGGTVPLTESVK